MEVPAPVEKDFENVSGFFLFVIQVFSFAEYLNLGDANISIAPGVVVNKEESVTPRCWKTVYYLLDLYATMPETKTIAHRSLQNFIFNFILLIYLLLLACLCLHRRKIAF